MSNNERLKYGQISFDRTVESDLDQVLKWERGSENASFIRHWPLEKHRAAIVNPDIAHFTIQNLTTSAPIGYVILIGTQDPDLNLEFKRIVVAEKGQGYGRNAVRLIKIFAFEQLHFHRLWLDVMEHNNRAYRLYESEGFKVEGVRREAVKQGEGFVSLTLMSMLQHEYIPPSK